MYGNGRKVRKSIQKLFKRTEIIDATNLYPGGMEIEDLSNFILEKTELYQSTLVIVNTTTCALKTFQHLKEVCSQDYVFFTLVIICVHSISWIR